MPNFLEENHKKYNFQYREEGEEWEDWSIKPCFAPLHDLDLADSIMYCVCSEIYEYDCMDCYIEIRFEYKGKMYTYVLRLPFWPFALLIWALYSLKAVIYAPRLEHVDLWNTDKYGVRSYTRWLYQWAIGLVYWQKGDPE